MLVLSLRKGTLVWVRSCRSFVNHVEIFLVLRLLLNVEEPKPRMVGTDSSCERV